jgi:transposase
MSRSLFWLSDEAWLAIEPHLPKNQPGPGGSITGG